MATEASLVKREVLWCDRCEGNLVDSDNQTTGKFFTQIGYLWSPADMKITGTHKIIIYALCSDCLSGKTVMNDGPII